MCHVWGRNNIYCLLWLSKIEFPEKLLETEYDYVVCAVLKEGQANNMKNQLIGLGIEESRILWKEPINPPIEIFLKKK